MVNDGSGIGTLSMAFDASAAVLDHELMVLDLELFHALPFRFCPADFELCLLSLEMLFHITVNDSREHLDIAAAEVEHADMFVDWVAKSFVFGGVEDRGQIQVFGSGTRLARGDQHVVAKVVLLQGVGEVLTHPCQ
jgi:hypothetical protein